MVLASPPLVPQWLGAAPTQLGQVWGRSPQRVQPEASLPLETSVSIASSASRSSLLSRRTSTRPAANEEEMDMTRAPLLGFGLPRTVLGGGRNGGQHYCADWGLQELTENLIGLRVHLYYPLPAKTFLGDPLPFPVACTLDFVEDPYLLKAWPMTRANKRAVKGSCPHLAPERGAHRRTLALTSASNDECCA